jgi:hypothetical protein
MPQGRIAAAQARYAAAQKQKAYHRTSFNAEMIARAKRAAYERILELLTAERDALDAKARAKWLAAQAAAEAEAAAEEARVRAMKEAEEAQKAAAAAKAEEKERLDAAHKAAAAAAEASERAARKAVREAAEAKADVRSCPSPIPTPHAEQDTRVLTGQSNVPRLTVTCCGLLAG